MQPAIAALFLLAAGALRPDPTVELMRHSTLVFAGTAVNAAKAGDVALVRIDDIYFGRQSVGGAAGETVRLAVTSDVREGESHIWFTSVIAWRDLLDLREIGREPSAGRKRVARTIRRAAKFVADERLLDWLLTADLIVEGSVVSVHPFDNGPSRSEHNPIWTEADIKVSRRLYGRSGRSVAVLFPRAFDIMWFAAPKLRQGSRGTFVLHRTAPHAPKDAGRFLFIMDYRDFYPPAQRAHIRRLVEQIK